MSKSKSVTTAQAEQVRKMANEKGLGRKLFQDNLLDNGTMSRVLDAVKGGLLITFGIPLIPPPGGRIHILKVKTQLDQEWQTAINTAGHDTPDSYNVRKVGNLYSPTGMGVAEEELILLNYPAGDGSWDKAIAWAKQFSLRKTDPRRVFAVGEGYPKFNYDIGPNPCYVVATEECMFDDLRQAGSVWWDDSEREAFLFWVSYYGDALGWFAFRR